MVSLPLLYYRLEYPNKTPNLLIHFSQTINNPTIVFTLTCRKEVSSFQSRSGSSLSPSRQTPRERKGLSGDHNRKKLKKRVLRPGFVWIVVMGGGTGLRARTLVLIGRLGRLPENLRVYIGRGRQRRRGLDGCSVYRPSQTSSQYKSFR